jgi:uncharacterized membrane protein
MSATRNFRRLALTAYFALFALVVAWHAWLAPPTQISVILVLALAAGPLLFPLYGLLYGSPYTYAWTSFLALPYFIHGIGQAYAGPSRGLGGAELVLSLALYVGAVFYARLRGRELRNTG